MAARKSAPKQDHTEQPLLPTLAAATPAPDGAASAAEYNRAHGRVPSAPTVGGKDIHKNRSPRGYAPGAPTPKSPRKPID